MEEFEQMSLIEASFEPYRIKNKIRLIELFGGIGAQAKALEILGADFEHYRLVEWAVNSIIGYNAIHIKDFADHSEGMTKEELIAKVRGVSADYNRPLTDDELSKKGEKWLRKVYSSMVATHDICPDISRCKAEDLGIRERELHLHLLLLLPLPRHLWGWAWERLCQGEQHALRASMGGREASQRTQSDRFPSPDFIDGKCSASVRREQPRALELLADRSGASRLLQLSEDNQFQGLWDSPESETVLYGLSLGRLVLHLPQESQTPLPHKGLLGQGCR